ncbi:MmgE/PrpD family protein [Bordetella bronchialis]
MPSGKGNRVESNTSAASLRMAQWVGALSPGHIPAAVRQAAVSCILDTVGVAVAGSLTPPATAALSLCAAASGAGSTVLAGLVGPKTAGRAPSGTAVPAHAAPQQAAFANAVAAHALDFDDNCYAGFVHGSAVIVPALLACAQAVGANGAQAVTALVAGAECEYAVGAATRGLLYDQGWWTTGVLGPIGAAMAVCKLLDLDAPRIAHALALAVGMAAGTKSCFGSDAKPLMAGKASEAGVQAALLAQAGACGPADPFGHGHGFAARYNQGVLDIAALEMGSDRWYLLDPGLDVKRIPVCLSSHAAVDALRALIVRHGLRPGDVASVVCDVPPIVAANLCHDMPDTPAQARFSMPFAIAMTLLEPEWGLAALAPGQLARTDLREAMRRVRMETGPSWHDPSRRRDAPEGAIVRVECHDGTVLRGERDKAIGSPGDPLSPAQSARKFLDCTADVIGEAAATRLLAQLRDLDGPMPVQALFDTLAAASSVPAADTRPDDTRPE